MDRIEANGIAIAYDSFGNPSGETILLVAGLGTTMLRWSARFCEKLAAPGYRVVRFDNRDSGRSTAFAHHPPPDLGELVATLMAGGRPAVPYRLSDMAADALGLLDALRINQAHVVGRSMGGMIAQIMASDAPERMLSLTSIMSSTGNPALPQAEPDAMALMMRPAPDPAHDREAYLAQATVFARRIAGNGGGFDEAAHRALLLAELAHGQVAGGTARQVAAMVLAGDRRAQLATITAPTLVIHGTEDPLIPSAGGEDTAASIAGAEMLLIDGMGHDLPTWLEDAVIAAIHRTMRLGRP